MHLRETRFILWCVLGLNLFVAFTKLGYGLYTGSLGMQADGFHSLFDGISNVVGLVGLWLASALPDDDHPYGHKKFETLAAAGIGGMLVSTCLYILLRTYQSFGDSAQPHVTVFSFAVMIVTMAINYGVARWEQRKGLELNSEILIADSYHTASDFLTSLSVLIGLIAIRLEYPLVDPVVAIIIAGVIAWTAVTVLREVASSLTDRIRLDPEAVRAVVLKTAGVVDCDQIRTRGLSQHIFVDLSIHVIPTMSVAEAHEVAHHVENSLKARFNGVEDVVVHIEPEGQRSNNEE